jgi:hypothetical protein
LSADYTFDLLQEETESPTSSATRGDFLRRLVTGGGALMVGGTVLAEFAPGAQAASTKTDLTILNAALILENLGVTFYGEAMKNVKLTGETKTFVKVVHGHEVQHAKFVKKALGSHAKKLPGFSFGKHTASQAAVEKFAEKLEGICTEALVGVAPLLTRATLAKAGPLLPVEAQHVAWISNIRKQSPAPSAFNPKGTLTGVEKMIAPYLTKS